MTLTQSMPLATAPRPDAPPPWRQIADKPVGGFLKCPSDWLLLPWSLYRAGRLDFFGLRTWCGLLELPERRGDRPLDQDVHYSIAELARLLDVSRRAPVQTAVRTIEDLGLVAWSMSSIAYLPTPAALYHRALPGYQALQAQLHPWRTWVPVPRRLVRWLAREGNPGLWATAAGVLLRCLWSKQRQCVSGGRVAAAWIAEGFGVTKRTVQRRLDSLQACGWLERLRSTDAADARLAQRHGARTVVNLQWDAPGDCEPEDTDEAPAPQKAKKDKSRPACEEVAVEHFVKHPTKCDQNLSPLPPVCDQNLSPLPPQILPETPGKYSSCATPSRLDLYPLQEQRPDPLSARHTPEMPAGVCQNMPTGIWQNTPEESTPPSTKVTETPHAIPQPTPPTSASPVQLEAAAVFAALPSAEQDELLQAATARLLSRGLPAVFLIRPVVCAEVYVHMTPSSLATAPAEAPRAPSVGVPVSATSVAPPAVSVPLQQAPRGQAAAPGRPVPLADPAAAFAALPQVEQDEMLAEVTARLLAQGMRKDLLLRPLLLAEVYAQLAPPSSPSVTPPSNARHETPPSARPSRASAPAKAKTPGAEARPDLRDVVPADLRDVTRLEALREQAIQRGWLTECEADRLNFVAAAVHARRIGKTPCRLFVALVRDKRWVVLTDGDEDEARRLLRQRDPRLVRASAAPTRGLSEDARFVRGVQQILRQEGWQGDPFVAIAARYPDWTRARWDTALVELRASGGGWAMGRLGEVLGEEE